MLRGTTPFLPSRLCQPLHHPGTQASLLSFSKEGKKKTTWSCSTFSTGRGRVLPLDKVARQHLAHRAQPIWKAPTAPTPTCVPHGPLHCRNEYARACLHICKEKGDVPISALYEALRSELECLGRQRVEGWGGGVQPREGGERGRQRQ